MPKLNPLGHPVKLIIPANITYDLQYRHDKRKTNRQRSYRRMKQGQKTNRKLSSAGKLNKRILCSRKENQWFVSRYLIIVSAS